MASMKTDANTLAALTAELVPQEGDTVPTEAHLLLPGPFRSSDGRPRDVAAWKLDQSIAAAVIARVDAKAGDCLIDYEHQSLHAEWNGQPVPAAGWFKSLEWREGKGLYATGIRWTERARGLIAAREYRYISAVFSYLPQTGEVLEIVSVALTNTPALDGLDALVAARKLTPNPQLEMADMAADEKELAALTSECDSLKTNNAVLTQERDGALAELAALKAKNEAAAQEAEKAVHADLLRAALTDGRITPALKPWAEKLPLAALKEYLDSAAPAAVLNKQADGKPAPTSAALTKEEIAMCEKLGVSHDAFQKAKE